MVQRKKYMDKLIKMKDKKIIKVVTGIRRCGKSTLLLQYSDYLKKSGVEEKQIISVNFEDIASEPLLDYRKLHEYVTKRLLPGIMTYVFLDEIQNVPQFQKTADSLFIKDNVDVYITGSNAQMLSGELATLLSGRYVEINMLPLSFAEYYELAGGDRRDAWNNYYRNGGLEWSDINWEKCLVKICRSSQYITGKGIFTKDTKTATSDRSIKLPVTVFDMLKSYRAWQNEEKLTLGKYWQDSNRLFTTFDGDPIHPDTITWWFAKFIKRNNLDPASIHSLRHTNITLLIMSGVPLQTVAKRAGHSSSVTTSMIYSHAIQSADEMASDVLGDILKPKRVGVGGEVGVMG